MFLVMNKPSCLRVFVSSSMVAESVRLSFCKVHGGVHWIDRMGNVCRDNVCLSYSRSKVPPHYHLVYQTLPVDMTRRAMRRGCIT
jgi:hypothetical protein